MADTYTGGCFCGAVTVEVRNQPEVMGYCHCDSCRGWSASPVNAFTLWKPENVTVTKGEEHLGSYAKTEVSHRQWCRLCGGHVLGRHPTFGMVDVFAATIPSFPFAPTLHINYGEKVLAIPDGLPKFKDFPAPFGGSGDTLPE